MSTEAVRTPVPAAPVFKPSYLARGIAFFSGTVGFAIKVALLALLNAVAVWAATTLIGRENYIAVFVLLAATAGIDFVYLVPRKKLIPLKFLIPGTVFLVAFQIAPVLYTINVAFTNYSTGHLLEKSEAVAQIQTNSLAQTADGAQYLMAYARDKGGALVEILQDESNDRTYVGRPNGLTPIPREDVTTKAGVITAAKGYALVSEKELFSIQGFRVPIDGAAIEPQGFTNATALKPTLRYDASKNEFVGIDTGQVFEDDGNGSFVAAVLTPSQIPTRKAGELTTLDTFLPSGSPSSTESAFRVKSVQVADGKAEVSYKVIGGPRAGQTGTVTLPAGKTVSVYQRQELEPGWKTGEGFHNFGRVIHDPLVSSPFLRVFAWTFVFAGSVVLFSFAIGLMLALVLDKPGMRFQWGYRSLLIIPYAIPGFLSLLIWGGMLNDDFGVVNKLLTTLFDHWLHITGPIHVPWIFGSDWWARVAVIMVSVWLTVPYFFLVSLGALQSIPAELVEAAKVDGGGPFQIFRRVRLPLLFVAVAPLMIASFAFNFNNFNNVFLLTGGGPASNDQSVAGATDILISYTYKIAFTAGRGNDYALASTIAIIIFFVVAFISGVSFWRTKALETMR
jgi:ABC-type sugar transport system permease subunit